MFRSLGSALVPCLLLSCALTTPTAAVDRTPYALGGFHRDVSSSSEEAQLWFDRGLALSYAFNHEEAIRCFARAAEADPGCAMAYWGSAYASGPNINNVEMDEAAVARAWENVNKAQELIGGASPVEAALIRALATRYVETPGEDRSELERAYAAAMREVYDEFGKDPDVAALFAESLMLLRPWYQWTPEGDPTEETPEIRKVLETGMAATPEHPALCHLYIHAMEASPEPSLALPAANRLRESMPGAGHLVHMPSHIDVLVGDYEASIIANQKALEADAEYVKSAGVMNFYTLYRIHNFHFIVYSAMFDAQSELAMTTARELVRQIPAEMLEEMPDFVEAFVPTPLHVLVRFGRWEEILAEPAPPEDYYVTRAVRHYARGLAFAATGRVEEAEAEREAFAVAQALVPETRILFNNTGSDILLVAEAMLAGEVEYRRGNLDAAFRHLREAVRRDDALNYDEPWGWMQPARHALGALLLEQGRVEEAGEVFRADLRRHPKNAWALHGLEECLRRSGKESDADSVRAQLGAATVRADVRIKASCYCRLDALE
ncbi:MAG: tetratricopeptide repeat protein [Gemmatimonadetes bacterium]|nr:tetratricopeptide repeat protein [Gemmatimonadota bacterium]